MSSKESPQGERDDEKDIDGEKRRSRRVFCQSISSGDSASDMETDDEAPSGSKQRKRTTIGNLLYKSKRKTLEEDSNDKNLQNQQVKQSHLLSLVRKQKAMHKYANKLVKNEDNKKGANDRVTVEETDNAKFIEAEGEPKKIASSEGSKSSIEPPVILTDEQKEEAKKTSNGILLVQQVFKDYGNGSESEFEFKSPTIDIRMENLSFSVPCTEASTKITTVYNSSFVYKTIKALKRLVKGRTEETKHAKVSYTKIGRAHV